MCVQNEGDDVISLVNLYITYDVEKICMYMEG
jgi:hypothetical protein